MAAHDTVESMPIFRGIRSQWVTEDCQSPADLSSVRSADG